MSPPDDAPPAGRLARWSEWWFTPRWRALLTWVTLTAISSEVMFRNWLRFIEIAQQPIVYLDRLLPAPLPPIFGSIAYDLTYWLLLIWFQPLALRLSLRRGLVWIGLPLVAEILWHVLDSSPGSALMFEARLGSTALQYWVLHGWRSRPWLCLPAQIVTNALWVSEPLHDLHLAYGIKVAVFDLPNALLLYGTRLLCPEERAGGLAAK